MKNLLVFVGLSLIGAASASFAEEATRMTNPNAVSVEILGRSFLYGFNYDRVMNDYMAAGFGVGSSATKTLGDVDASTNAVFVPIYLNYYFQPEAGSLFLTAGATLVTNQTDVKGLKTSTGGLEFPSNSVLPQFGLGYENRGDFGFLFRLTAYGTLGKKLVPWAGFTFGYAF